MKNVLIATISAFLSFAPLQSVQAELESPVFAALTRCLANNDVSPIVDANISVPPGLTDGQSAKVSFIPSTGGRGFLFEGSPPREISCGIALYGPVSGSVQRAIVRHVDALRPQWHRAHRFVSNHPGRVEEFGWGIPPVPAGHGIVGVVMLVRRPSAAYPTVEVRSYSIPVS